jgi:hypothetical protein
LLGAQTDFASLSALPLAFSAVHSGTAKSQKPKAKSQKPKAKSQIKTQKQNQTAKSKPPASLASRLSTDPEKHYLEDRC